jgi:hypothetical protein
MQSQTGAHTITAADPLPDDLRDALDLIQASSVRTDQSRVDGVGELGVGPLAGRVEEAGGAIVSSEPGAQPRAYTATFHGPRRPPVVGHAPVTVRRATASGVNGLSQVGLPAHSSSSLASV